MREIIEFNISCKADTMHEKSFVVSHAPNTLYLDVNMPEDARYMGYLFLQDAQGKVRLQKLLGYGMHKIAIGEDGMHTTIGGVPGKICTGKWKIALGIFTEYVHQRLGEKEVAIEIIVTDESMEITETIGINNWTNEKNADISLDSYDWNYFYQTQKKWYKGDFHTHTTLSDGKETIRNAMKKAEDMELDFYVPTEHNLMHTGWCDSNCCILPGIEITTEAGHFNLFGITKMPRNLLDIIKSNGSAQMEIYVRRIMQEAAEMRWIVSINHPFLGIWNWKYADTKLNSFQCVEIINDPTYQGAQKSNDRAIAFLDALWNDGHRIWGVGGSDAHNLIGERYEGAELPSVAGDPGTYVYCEGLSARQLLEQLRKGRACVTRFCKIMPKITVGEKEYLPGDEILQKNETITLTYAAKIYDIEEEPEIFLVKNGQKEKVMAVKSASGVYEISKEIVLETNHWNWVRLEVRSKNGVFLGFVNPVSCGRMTSLCSTMAEIWEKMGETT